MEVKILWTFFVLTPQLTTKSLKDSALFIHMCEMKTKNQIIPQDLSSIEDPDAVQLRGTCPPKLTIFKKQEMSQISI